MGEPSSSKRKAEDMLKGASKVKKLNQDWSIFSKGTSGKTSFRWLTPVNGSCLHGVHKDPVPKTKVAVFDLDGTLIRPKGGKKHPRDGDDWEWWHMKVKRRLNQATEEGYSIVIVSNQGGFDSSSRGQKRKIEWQRKIPQLAAQLPQVPFRAFAACSYDKFRKPLPGIWHTLEDIHRTAGVIIDRSNSYFVGDAAGRPGDHSSADRLFALNAGISFLTPEEYFLEQAPTPYTLSSWDPASLPTDLPLFSPCNTPLVPATDDNASPELVLFVGYPSIGKTTFFKKHFTPKNYIHVNQDMLKTMKKCLDEVRKSVKGGKSCVVDNTNRDKNTRESYVELAKELGITIRCMNFSASLELASHNNVYRAYFAVLKDGEQRREILPFLAFASFKKAYEAPTLDEGFDEIKTINWLFEGTDEDRRLWNFRE